MVRISLLKLANNLTITCNLSNSILSYLFVNGVSFIIFANMAAIFNHENFEGSVRLVIGFVSSNK